MARTGLLLVGHGSRERAANAEFESLVETFARRKPELDIAHAYVELAEPALGEGIARLARRNERVLVIPCFLFAAGHVKNDIPLALAAARRRFPRVRFVAARALGVHPAMVALLGERAVATLAKADFEPAQTALVLVGRGASDPDANADFFKLARLFGEGRDFAWVVPSFVGITRPLFEEAIELMARARPRHIAVLPYLLFGGRLIAKLREQVDAFSARYPWIATTLAPHLGAHERLFEALEDRMREAIEGEAPLPCDNCHYRVPVGAIADQVGGLRALLWSVRHTVTHNQAMPHVHAHRALSRHVLVCANVDCASRGSVALIATLRREIRRAGRERDIRVTRTACMGRCGEGPTVAVYPDGVWYRGVASSDAAELVREHLLGDRLVARLVDGIMQ